MDQTNMHNRLFDEGDRLDLQPDRQAWSDLELVGGSGGQAGDQD